MSYRNRWMAICLGVLGGVALLIGVSLATGFMQISLALDLPSAGTSS